jgi:ABC-type lipoprotein release transport system permease subunit
MKCPVRYAWAYLRSGWSRSLLTMACVALCTVLATFLLSVYRGVSDGTLEYIRANRCDLWVLQDGTTNIVRGSSLLPAAGRSFLESLEGVTSASPILLTLAVVHRLGREGTVYLVGYDPAAPLGGPPRLTEGRPVLRDEEIVLDRCFARKYHLAVGDTVTINEQALTVTGIADGTNAFVVQYAFVTLAMARRLVGDLPMTSAYLVSLSDPERVDSVKTRLLSAPIKVSIFTHDQFIRNNRREMQSGFLPFIVAVCVITVGVLIAILSLLLSMMVMEQRADYAVMKTIGAPASFLPALVLQVAGLVAAVGIASGILLFFPVALLVRQIAPELTTITTPLELARIGVAVGAACLLSALLPLRKLHTIYPTEAFQ